MIRYSNADMKNRRWFIERFTNHKITIIFGLNSRVTLIVDGVEYDHLITRGERKGTFNGITRSEAMEILKPLWNEAFENSTIYYGV